MNRRRMIRMVLGSALVRMAPRAEAAKTISIRREDRARPGGPQWPDEVTWNTLREKVGNRLVEISAPFASCRGESASSACADLFKQLKNPYFIGDQIGLTQTLGWVDAWTSQPSICAVVPENTADVAATVDFARENNLRLVVKGGGHSYQGTSNSIDSLLIWTRRMDGIEIHGAFVALGCSGSCAPQPAVTVEAGALWGHVYDAVTTKAHRYVQGGGCLTVGVAGLVLGGGFGSFSKAYGTAAANLIQAEIVTADGRVRIANARMNPDLFWALKGGGGGSLGVVTRLTLKTHDLPRFFGAVFLKVRATSEATFRTLVDTMMTFYSERLFNAHWGEQIGLHSDNTLSVSMVCQGLDQDEPTAIWSPLLAWLKERRLDFRLESPPVILSVPARQFWDPDYLRKIPGLILTDDRSGSRPGDVFWAANLGETGQVLHAYQSNWLPSSLLENGKRSQLVDALVSASRHHDVSLHFNKGLGGASTEVIADAQKTATNPAVLDAFALLICGAKGPPAYPGVVGHELDVSKAGRDADAVEKAMGEIRSRLPVSGSYLSEANFFETDWQKSFWGENYPLLLATKNIYDPDCLFFVHHGVGSESWSADGFAKLD